jgi:hypothetical protein
MKNEVRKMNNDKPLAIVLHSSFFVLHSSFGDLQPIPARSISEPILPFFDILHGSSRPGKGKQNDGPRKERASECGWQE